MIEKGNETIWLDGNDYLRYLVCIHDIKFSLEEGFTLDMDHSVEKYLEYKKNKRG